MNPHEQLFNQAIGLHRGGDLAGAERLYEQLLSRAAPNAVVLQMLGVARAQQGRFAEALDSLNKALAIEPKAAEAWMNKGNVLRALGRREESLAAYESACALNPNYVEAFYNRSLTLLEFGRPAEALKSIERALALAPNFPEAWSNRGFALTELGRFVEARAAYDKLLTLRPGDPDALNKRGIVLWNLNRRDEALESFDQALRAKPDFVDAWCNRANSLRHMKRLDEALASCERALAINPSFVPALDNRGIILWEMKRLPEAVAAYGQALALEPGNVIVLNNRSIALREMKRFDEALADCSRALALQPRYADAFYNRANILRDMRRFAEALADYERAAELAPDNRHVLSGIADAATNICDWARTEKITEKLASSVEAAIVSPLILFGYDLSPELQLQYTKSFLASRVPPSLLPLPPAPAYRHEKIRLAYVSSDFNRHPVSYQIAELIERHDRSRFEVNGISIGRDDGSELRARMVRAFDGFHDVQNLDSRAIAELMRRLEIDIAIDLNGHTNSSRVEIFAYRPAPVQVNYLGYPGTMGADFIDYIIGDEVLLPVSLQPQFSEKIVRLPNSFWVSDSTRTLGAVPTRAEAGLPENGFVYCAFNNHWKITERVFSVWMRLLAAVPDSVLWLKHASPDIAGTLRREASARGIAPERLIFAPPIDAIDAYLARHAAADLYLDTLPYNAHASASDALWAGLPVVTCMGRNFPGRVAASLLKAIDFPELITEDLASYEALALALARDPVRLSAIRTRLAHNRLTSPLFDTGRLCRDLEAAYIQMRAS